MKKFNFLVALATLATSVNWAQPVITATDVNTTNFTADFLYSEATGFSPGNAGANQTWDFSGLDLLLLGTNAVLPVASTPHAATFPLANYCYTFDSDWGGGDRYYYHILTPEKFEILSIAYSTTQGGDNYNENPRTFMEFPYTYNKVYTDTYQSTEDEAEKSVVTTYDAYGTVIMPYGTLTNVVRQKIVTDGVTDYIWFNVNPFYPVLQTVLAENSLGIIKNTTSVLGTPDNIKNIFSVYPNPTSGDINIKTASDFNQELIVSVYNAMGSCIVNKVQAFENRNDISLSIQNQPAGIYFLKITNNQNAAVFSQKIIKR